MYGIRPIVTYHKGKLNGMEISGFAFILDLNHQMNLE
jgi:hypothetical protein